MRWFLCALFPLLAAEWRGAVAQGGCCSPKSATVFESFATVLDAQVIGLAASNSAVEFVVPTNHTYTLPSWLKLTPGADGSSSSGQTGSKRSSSSSSVILYGSPQYSDGNTSSTLQIVVVDSNTLANSRATLSIEVKGSPRYYTQFYRLLYPLQELSTQFVTSSTAQRLASELQGVYAVPMYVLELTQPRERGIVVRRSVTAPEGLYITMATPASVSTSVEIARSLQSRQCSSVVIARIVAAGNTSDYCFEELVDVTIATSPVAGLSSVVGHEPYRPVAYNPGRRDHRDSFVTAIAVAAVCALAVGLLYISFMVSRNKRVPHTTTDGSRSTQQGSRHRDIHGATVLLRHMTSVHEKFDNPIYDEDYADTGAHFSNAAVPEEEHEDVGEGAGGGVGVMAVATHTAAAAAGGPTLRSARRSSTQFGVLSREGSSSDARVDGNGAAAAHRPSGQAQRSEQAGATNAYTLHALSAQAPSEVGYTLVNRGYAGRQLGDMDASYDSASTDTGPPRDPAPRHQRAPPDQSHTGQRGSGSDGRHAGQSADRRRGDAPAYRPATLAASALPLCTATNAPPPPPYRPPLVPGLASSSSSWRASATPRPTSRQPVRTSAASMSGLSTATTSQIDELIDEINELEDQTHT